MSGIKSFLFGFRDLSPDPDFVSRKRVTEQDLVAAQGQFNQTLQLVHSESRAFSMMSRMLQLMHRGGGNDESTK